MEGVCSASAGYDLGKGRHAFQFGIDFPMLASCSKLHPEFQRRDRTLPPSFNVCTSELKINAAYILRATAHRPRMYQRRLITEEEVTFIPLDPPGSALPSASLCCHKRTQAMPGEVLGFSEHFQPRGTLPLYSPALFLEGVIVSATTLYPGSKLPLELYVTSSSTVLEGLNNMVWLRSLDILLRSKTTVQVGRLTSVAVSETPLKSIRTKLQLEPSPETETFQIDSQLWKECKIPKVTPTFSCCVAKREHMIEIVAGFSSEMERKVKVSPLLSVFESTWTADLSALFF